MSDTDTICALSTPEGPGGIAVIRLSGPRSAAILHTVFRSAAPLEERRLVFGRVMDGKNAVDEAMAVVFNAPRSYTGEDMAELHCHGGALPVSRVLSLLVRAGARPAEPGEFTRRAFLNGKMDLSRAEAVMGYISATSEAGAKAAFTQLSGALFQKISAIQDRLTDLLAQTEAVIEYPDEDSTADIEDALVSGVRACREDILALYGTYEEGRILREGYSVAIAGKPNVGKSSLLNYLAGRPKAIVTEYPGTTRDIVEDTVTIRGLSVKFSDTAGLRETGDPVEALGVQRSYRAMDEADLILLVVDLSEGVTPEDKAIFEANRNRNLIVVFNKTDLNGNAADEAPFAGKEVLRVSALSGEGVPKLRERIYRAAVQDEQLLEGVVITSERHKNSLFSAAQHLGDALEAHASGLMLDCLSIDIKAAWNDLGLITGLTVTEEIIDRIFSTFCLGK